MRSQFCLLVQCLCSVFLLGSLVQAQRLEIPRRHDRPPGPPVSAAEAVKRMVVPEGFSVEIVAEEPDVVNPVAMCIDEQGRFWITESLEYPRREPGPGRDRIKVLEDTDGDGKVDKTTIFAEGLNIPSGINVGHGGVWVANSPDLLFMEDTDGDLRADKTTTVVTGFGRTDTHELPNSLTWGPDGWLYGLNGVFNYSHVRYTPDNPNFREGHAGWPFTCALFRIHPRTWEFQVFAQGTSNPWGIAMNPDGEFFLSACVIDHLWHIAESGYYIRQGGPYPPHTWPMHSIVNHHHQKAAYCGITWFDSANYPAEYNNVLYMGNIHGGCINADVIEREGASYSGKAHPGFPAPAGAFQHDTVAKIGEGEQAKLADFLTANDAWFMPVVQQTGPDGCLYILDWYDRYHCYQDANADPEGIERERGRLYRVVYKGHEHRKFPDLSRLTDEQLVLLLDGNNEYERHTARRLLSERLTIDSPAIDKLIAAANDTSRGTPSRLRAFWALASADLPFTTLNKVNYDDECPELRAWIVRILADQRSLPAAQAIVATMIFSEDDDVRVMRQQIVAIPKISNTVAEAGKPTSVKENAPFLLRMLSNSKGDELNQHLTWQNLLPYLQQAPDETIQALREELINEPAIFDEFLPRAIAVLAEHPQVSGKELAGLMEDALQMPDLPLQARVASVTALTTRLRQRALSDAQLADLKAHWPQLKNIDDPGLASRLTILQAILGNADALDKVRQTFANKQVDRNIRLEALETLVAAGDTNLINFVAETLSSRETPPEFRSAVIGSLGQVNNPRVAEILLSNFQHFEPAVKPKAIEVLTQRANWTAPLLQQIQEQKIDKAFLNMNQLQRISRFKDAAVQERLAATYGTIREERRSDRQHVINFHRDFLRGTPGDPHQGVAIFKKVCAQCHKIYGEGAEVGPDITRNGRNNWDQLLQNVFDPSAVIGPGYQARLLATTDGRVLTGLPVEESEQRVILKVQGGKLETIPRDQIEEYKVSELSMMPEQLEKQLTPQELADLFAYLALDKPPTDPTAKILSGAPEQKPR